MIRELPKEIGVRIRMGEQNDKYVSLERKRLHPFIRSRNPFHREYHITKDEEQHGAFYIIDTPSGDWIGHFIVNNEDIMTRGLLLEWMFNTAPGIAEVRAEDDEGNRYTMNGVWDDDGVVVVSIERVWNED